MTAETNLNASEQKVIRLNRPSVVVLCGPAACGKSTFAAQHFRPTQIISSDHARGLVCDDERDQRYQTQAFALVHFLIEQRLGLNRMCVVDSTALTVQARKNLLEIARRNRVPAVMLLFNIPLNVCIERDRKRERTVGQPTIEHQHHLFEQAKAGVKREGFDQVIELSDEELAQVRFEIVFRPVPRPATIDHRAEPRRFAPRPQQPPAEAAPPARNGHPPAAPSGKPSGEAA
jgi:protein phosphatase